MRPPHIVQIHFDDLFVGPNENLQIALGTLEFPPWIVDRITKLGMQPADITHAGQRGADVPLGFEKKGSIDGATSVLCVASV